MTYYVVFNGFFPQLLSKNETLYILTKFPIILVDLRFLSSGKEKKIGKC